MNNWDILGIEKTTDLEEIKAAYAKEATKCHPEENPEQFLALQRAYKEATRYAKNAGSEPQDTKREQPDLCKSTYMMDRIEEAERQAYRESFHTPAMERFCAIFEDEKKRESHGIWKEYFLSDEFLKEQFEPTFFKALCDYLMEQTLVEISAFPPNLLVWLAMVYACYIDPNNHLIPIRPEEATTDAFNYVETDLYNAGVSAIWNQQKDLESLMLLFDGRVNITIRRAFGCYKKLYFCAKDYTWDKMDYSMEAYKYSLAMCEKDFLLTDEQAAKSKMSIFDLEDDHINICFIDMVEFLMKQFVFPKSACAYLYKECNLKKIEKTKWNDTYKNIKQLILEKHPDIEDYSRLNVSEDEYAKIFEKQMKTIRDKYAGRGWSRYFKENNRTFAVEIPEECKEEIQAVKDVFESPLFQKYKFSPNILLQITVLRPSREQADQILYEYTKTNEAFENPQLMRALHDTYFAYKYHNSHAQYLVDQDFEYQFGIDTREFWYYYLSVAYGDRAMKMEQEPPIASSCVYANYLTLPSYINYVFRPSKEWRRQFTNYDLEEGVFKEAPRMEINLGEDMKWVIECHYHYVRYFLNDNEVLHQVLEDKQLLELTEGEENDLLFLLLLPITEIDSCAQMIFNRLMEILPNVFEFYFSTYFVSCMITNNNSVLYTDSNIKTRRYFETLKDCYRLESDVDNCKSLYKLNHTVGVWENMDQFMIGRHYRGAFEERKDEEGYDMETFKASDLMLSFEKDVKRYALKNANKIQELLKLAEKTQNIILAYGSPDCLTQRYRFRMYKIATREELMASGISTIYLDDFAEQIDEAYECVYGVYLEDAYHHIPIARGVSGTYYAQPKMHKETVRGDSLEDVLSKILDLENLTTMIEYEVVTRTQN